MRDPFDFRPRVLARVEPGAVVACALRPEVEAADELADDDQVDPVTARRPKIRVDAELLPQAEELGRRLLDAAPKFDDGSGQSDVANGIHSLSVVEDSAQHGHRHVRQGVA